ncbi:50S ribosomal protein L22 [bacterium (Candidatus Torokbacteria) CG_4_10_14_0_2_um_filter_35_8]|nr:MAG: 50S ribosomal protein L22 [bacterium (Candidatus Torokbacteria) CG_4_10_14_0_2_um_filter_35_8]
MEPKKVKATLKYLRISPQKVRLVCNLIKGLPAPDAENQLLFSKKKAAKFLAGLLRSAIANAKNNFGLSEDNLYIDRIVVEEGPKFKRWIPKARGRSSMIKKRTSHVKLILSEREPGKERRKVSLPAISAPVKKEELEKKTKEKKKEKPVVTDLASLSRKKREEAITKGKKEKERKGFLRRIFRRKSGS